MSSSYILVRPRESPALLTRQRFDRSLHRRAVAHVELEAVNVGRTGVTQRCFHRLELLDASSAKQQPGTVARAFHGSSRADAGACAGNEDKFIGDGNAHKESVKESDK
jgi:hypothetical protein